MVVNGEKAVYVLLHRNASSHCPSIPIYTQGLVRYSDVMYKSKSFEINCWKHYTSDSQTPNGGFRLDNQLCPYCLLHIQLAEGGGAALFDLHKTHSSKFNGKNWIELIST